MRLRTNIFCQSSLFAVIRSFISFKLAKPKLVILGDTRITEICEVASKVQRLVISRELYK